MRLAEKTLRSYYLYLLSLKPEETPVTFDSWALEVWTEEKSWNLDCFQDLNTQSGTLINLFK